MGAEWRGQEWLQAIQERDIGIQVSRGQREINACLRLTTSTVAPLDVCVCVLRGKEKGRRKEGE